MLTNLPQMRLKLLQKEQYKKTPEAIDDLIGNKGVAKLEKFKKIRNKIIQRQLQKKMRRKYLKKHINLQKKNRT